MDRATRLRKLFNGILKGTHKISPRHSADFLDAIVAQEDASICLSTLTGSPAGLDALQDCMRYDLSSGFLNGRGSTLLAYLQDPRLQDIAGGMFLQQVLTKIVDPPIFWNAFVSAFRGEKLEKKGQLSFVGLLLQLLSFPNIDEMHRALAEDDQFMNIILDSPNPSIRALGAKIQSVVSASAQGEAFSGGFKPGGRHDNDFANFRDIAVLPTAAEISSTEAPFIRPSDVLEDPALEDQRLDIYLDNSFRLLREDMLYEMREEVLIAEKKKKGHHRGLILDGFKLVDIHFGPENRRHKWGIALQCETDPWIFKKVKPKDRKAFLDDNRSRYFRHQSLACLLVEGEIVAFATLNRDEGLLAKTPSVLVLQLAGDPTVKALTKLREAHPKRIRVILIDTAVFAFEPILTAIKETRSLSLSSELLFWDDDSVLKGPCRDGSRLGDLIAKLESQPSRDLKAVLNTSKTVVLDKSQHASLLSALTQDVSLIQGPPGTGKSFIGALCAKIIHDTTLDKILVVCYTNHALDQFLEDLLDIGIPSDSIVRLGGKSTPRTAPLALSSLQSQRLVPKLTRLDWTQIDRLKAEAQHLQSRLKTAFEKYQRMNINLSHILDHLEFADEEDIRFFDAFTVPEDLEEGDMTRVGKDGKALHPTFLIETWIKNGFPKVFKNHATILDAADVWAMTLPERHARLARWRQAIVREVAEDVHSLASQYNNCLAQLDDIYMRKDGELVASRRIIGCTTTAAAKYTDILRAACPEILLVEEAGEILESHILTALNPKSKQLILIGDHKQLRPKVNDYRLTVEKGEGYDLNMSLFERLVVKGYPHETLLEQHRMRPEISSLIRELTYPNLIDAPKTKNRPPLRGLQDVIVFVNHSFPEDELPDIADRRDLTSSSSKENAHEVNMVLKIVKYLAQQGYRTDQITILTPYLGQLQKLRRALAADNDPVLNDMDSFDLVRAGLMTAATANVSKGKIRLATIDNYQGEESEIIIASLTRSNSNRDIGFMSSPERLNVLLSRARDGLILIGNAETFSNARKGSEIWTKFFSLLKRGKHIYEGFPVRCERHPDRKTLLHKPEDFGNSVPDGGCLEDCGTILSCGLHACPSKCHPLSDHSKMPCETVVQSKCPQNHPQTWRCREGSPPSCKQCDKAVAAAKKKRQQALDNERKRETQKLAYDRELAELEEKIAREQEAARDAQVLKQQQMVLAQKRKDLESLSARSNDRSANSHVSTTPSVSSTSVSSSTPATISVPTAPLTSPPSVNPTHPISAPARSKKGPTSSSVSLPLEESKAEREWQRQKDFERASNDAIDAVMKLTGLEDVKAQMLDIKAKIDLVTRQNITLSDERFNVCMLGNPGTGKTTVARLYAQFLSSVGILPGSEFVETTGSRLANDGVPGIKKHIDDVLSAGGGAVFIDEAYQLVSEHNFQGSQVLDFVLAEMENNVGKVVFILAGYDKQMEKFFEHNPGLKSRVPYNLKFRDYTDEQLLTMLKRLIEKKYEGRMKLEGGVTGLYARIAVRRLGRGRGREGFGNARALHNQYSMIAERLAKRIREQRTRGEAPDDFMLLKEDLIGPEPSGALVKSASWAKLQKLIGLPAVKDAVRSLFDTLQTNYSRELEEKKPVEVSLNRVFTGSPGTGKTTVAKLYGQILADIGVLSNGEVVVKNPADFTGAHLGQSEEKTKAILASTVGKVLVIDEAYGLYGGSSGSNSGPDLYKTAVIDTIVAEVQSVPGEDRCVLLLGYKEQMEEMFQNVNPGLARRFAIENAFHFDDFTESELMEVLDLKMQESDIDASDDAKAVACAFLGRARNRPNFGNGGDVQNLLDSAKLRHQSRQALLPLKERSADIVLQPADFDPDHDRQTHASSNLQTLFEDLVDCDDIVQKLGRYQQLAVNMQHAGKDPRSQIPTTFIFKGPPGTGKTTVARKMGQVFYDMGFLSTKQVVECSASDLVGQYVGQTGPKVLKKFEQALGRVLFVDEAYRLGEGHFAQEAIDEMVGILTQERFMSKIVVILAGYDDDMNRLLTVNSGLSSRFTEEILFRNMGSGHCLEVLDKTLRKNDVVIEELRDHSSSHYLAMSAIFDELSTLSGWGNIRDVMTLSKKLNVEAFSDNNSTMPVNLAAERAITCMKSMLGERQSRSTTQSPITPLHHTKTLHREAIAPSPLPPKTSFTTATSTSSPTQTPPKKPMSKEVPAGIDCQRDAGVSDLIWHQLQLDKAAAEKTAQEAAHRTAELERQARETIERAKAEAALLKEQAKVRAKNAAERLEFKRRHEEWRLRAIAAKAERTRIEEAMEAERKKAREEAQVQQKLRHMGICPAGFRWIKQSNGYRCAGGAHFVGNDALL